MQPTFDLQLVEDDEAPVYHRIAQAICARLETGALVPGQKLPPMAILAKSLGVNTRTVSRGYELLQSRGIVIQRQGSGTYIEADALKRVGQVGKRQVDALIMVSGTTSLTACDQKTLFIGTDILDGAREVLGDVPIRFAEAFTQRALGDVGPGDAVLLWQPQAYDPALAGRLHGNGIRVVSAWSAGTVFGGRPRVEYDVFHAAVLACEHLIACGYRRIGYIGRKVPLRRAVGSKFAALAVTLHDAGCDLLARDVRDVGTMPGRAYAAATDLIQQGDLPDALFVDTDYKAMEVIAALNDAGLSVPHDIGIASFDDVAEAARFEPALTTVRVPRREIGRRTAQMLLDWPVDGSVPEDIQLDAELVVRGSTRRLDTQPRSRPGASRDNANPPTHSH